MECGGKDTILVSEVCVLDGVLLPVPVPDGGGGLSADEGGDGCCEEVCLSVNSELIDITFVDVVFVVHAPGTGDVPNEA